MRAIDLLQAIDENHPQLNIAEENSSNAIAEVYKHQLRHAYGLSEWPTVVSLLRKVALRCLTNHTRDFVNMM